MTSPTPIKRSPQLAPLSREHHDGLMFVWNLRQGIKKGTGTVILRKYVLWFWANHIKPHFFQEEKILMPHMPEQHPLGQQMKEEHEYIRELIISLDTEPERQTLTALCDLLERHIRFEEQKLFGFLEDLLPQEKLNQVQQELDHHPVSCEPWTDKFWEN